MNLKKFLFIFIFFASILFPEQIKAACNFKNSLFIDQLKNPNNIKNIRINTPKSKKYHLNALKIHLLSSRNIDTKLRKKFNADVIVQYPFGECVYKAKIWQNGDWKDHIQLINGKLLRSLNVKLKNGNINRAVKFKLFLPKTRNSLNEVLGSLIVRNLGLISPETFEVNVIVNNQDLVMIFQEDSQKEMLERNKRREGPIFEGDESIMWTKAYDSWGPLYAEDLSLSRLINRNWFLRGRNHQNLTLQAFEQLQKSYVIGHDYSGNIIFPNEKVNTIFDDFYFLMSSLNGYHALRKHNRKFYFNPITRLFEPIYYDGDLNLTNKIDLNHGWLNFSNAFNSGYQFPYIDLINSSEFESKLFDQFKKRVNRFDDKHRDFFQKSLSRLRSNIVEAQNFLEEIEVQNFDFLKINRHVFEKYKTKMKSREVEQILIKDVIINDKNVSILHSNNLKKVISFEDLSYLLSRNSIDSKRYVFLASSNLNNQQPENIYNKDLNGFLNYSEGIIFDINLKNKTIYIKQTEPEDWLLMNGIDLSNWKIFFDGIPLTKKNILNSDRINSNGLTGCLNIYNSLLNKTEFKISNGLCEDSLNVINSTGQIKQIEIENAYSDAVDFDFSNLEILFAKIYNAGNDCFDVSQGDYVLFDGDFNNCGDKGLSIGESSVFEINSVDVKNSRIGISIKDFSLMSAKNLDIDGSNICLELKQKKQEFGGSKASILDLQCEGVNIIDRHSSIEI